jgi:peptidoglycan/xylan/chitin deacetylase (PgdA/CDA1 family)
VRTGGSHATGADNDALTAGEVPAARDVSAPILMYHVINPPPAGAPFPGLYVPAAEFAEQMQALVRAGFHAVTLDQLWSHWSSGSALPSKPVVVTFDNGYQSQYTNALPVLRRLGWRAVENMQLTGLPPSQGGLSEAQVSGLVSAGWELDTQGISHADLITLDASQLREQVAISRQTIQRRYHVPVNWFCYPSGHYDATVIAAVKEAGYLGSTTVIPGWADPSNDPYRLPRLRVLGGTSGSQLVELISSTERDPAPPLSYG